MLHVHFVLCLFIFICVNCMCIMLVMSFRVEFVAHFTQIIPYVNVHGRKGTL